MTKAAENNVDLFDVAVKNLHDLLTAQGVSAEPPELIGVGGYSELYASLLEVRTAIMAFASGNLNYKVTAKGYMPGAIKALQASLNHLTWQTKMVSSGDFTQRVDFMGDFSESFNMMVKQLEKSRNELEGMNRQLLENNIKLQQQADAIRESEERLRHIAENVSDVIWTLDRSMEHFTYISPSIAGLRGLSVAEALQEPIEQAMTPESLATLRKALSNEIVNAQNHHVADSQPEVIEIEQVCQDGRVINVEVVISAITDSDGKIKEFVGVSRDITVRKKTEGLLKFQSTHDSLTGLYNRAFFDAELELAARGRQFPVSIIVADLDGLKQVNDTLGHGAGDQVIKGAATILQMVFRGNDIVARTGGDEFVVLLREMDYEEAVIAIERIRSCVEIYNANNGEPSVRISLGGATAATGEKIPETLKKADELMYADKILRKQQAPVTL